MDREIVRTLTLAPPPPEDGVQWDAVTARELQSADQPATLFAERCHVGTDAVFVLNGGRFEQNHDRSPAARELIYRFKELGNELFSGNLSALAPSGDVRASDLALTGTGDQAQWTVIVVSERGKTVHIRRRIYRTDE